MYLTIAFILLIAFAGKIYTFNPIGIKKSLWSYVNNNSEQEDSNDTEEGKFADKQLTGYFEMAMLDFAPLFHENLQSPIYHHSTAFSTSHVLTVPTPPPNC
ncbi:hypothetical protein [Mucilaginibacter terrae]|uniref:Uncharacterized protein n=1 Tax=Mucilaginibacter terrae TaxID=1955052 RepID=A0ABU3GXM3_9SPHI|nr:hypothetical protein [Mucilaginibacter terrae]MDT3404517.1 hypothetical protein [Mucilaginibacter terrae]